VTSGCGGGKFCPDRNVTRAEMAAFLNRLGALAANRTPVVNATKLDGIDSTGFAKATSRTIDSFSGAGTRILLDARTGADVRLGSSPGFIQITNTSTTRRMWVAGVGAYSTAAEGKLANLAPGESATFTVQTLFPTYLDVAITLSAASQSDVRYSHLTCSTADVGGGPNAMTSCIVVG
jgi:hypothetical protein